MPIYEFHCHDCQERVELFFRRFADLESKAAVCPACRGSHLARLVSNVAVVNPAQPAEARPPARPAGDSSDSRALARTMERASRQAGRDLGGDFKEVAGRLARGESARSVETALRKRVGEKMEPH